MIGALLALVVAANMQMSDRAELVNYHDRGVAVRIASVDWNEPGAANGYARAVFPQALRRASVERQVCVRADWRAPGTVRFESNRFWAMSFPAHGVGLQTTCVIVKTHAWPRHRPTIVDVSEGTYWGANGTSELRVVAFVRSVTVRKVPTS